MFLGMALPLAVRNASATGTGTQEAQVSCWSHQGEVSRVPLNLEDHPVVLSGTNG